MKRERGHLAYFRELGCNDGLDFRNLCIIFYFDSDRETPSERQGLARGRYFDGDHGQNDNKQVMTRRLDKFKAPTSESTGETVGDRNRFVDPLMVSKVRPALCGQFQ